MKSQIQNISEYLFLFFGLTVFLTLMPKSFAVDLPPKNHQQMIPLGPELSYFRVPISDPELSLDQVLHQKFIQSNDFIPNFGFSRDQIWVRLVISSAYPTSKTVHLEHRYVHTDHVELFSPKDQTVIRLGDRHPASNQIIPHYFPVFPLTISPGKNIFYLRVQSNEATTLPLFLNLNKQDSYYLEHKPVVIGGLTLLLCLVGFVVISLKSRSRQFQLAGFFYLLTCLLFAANHFFIQGFANKYFPQHDWSYWMNEGYFISAVCYQICWFFASYYFFPWIRFSKWFQTLKLLLISTTIGIGLGSIFLPYHSMVIPYFSNAILLACLMELGLLMSLQQRNRLCLAYMASWIPGMVVTLAAVANFFKNEYEHSFGFYYGGLFHFFIIAGFLLVSLYPARSKLKWLFVNLQEQSIPGK